MATCPACGAQTEGDFGMTTCSSCNTVFMLEIDGTVTPTEENSTDDDATVAGVTGDDETRISRESSDLDDLTMFGDLSSDTPTNDADILDNAFNGEFNGESQSESTSDFSSDPNTGEGDETGYEAGYNAGVENAGDINGANDGNSDGNSDGDSDSIVDDSGEPESTESYEEEPATEYSEDFLDVYIN